MTAAADADLLRAQRGYRTVSGLYETADVVVLGVGSIGDHAPILVDGFVSAAEMAELERDGAVGELMRAAASTVTVWPSTTM